MRLFSYRALTFVSSFQDVSQVVALNGSWKEPIEISDSDIDSGSIDFVQPPSKSRHRKRSDHDLGVIELTDSETSESDHEAARFFRAGSRRGAVKVGELAGVDSLFLIPSVC